VIIPALNAVIVRQAFDVIGGAQFEIERFTADVVAALNAADAGKALDRAKADADGDISLREARGPAVGKRN
jgi:hypothetical protein